MNQELSMETELKIRFQRVFRKHRILIGTAALFCVIGIVLYSQVILHGVFLFDDFEYIVDNPIISDLSALLRMSDPRQIGYLTFGLNHAMGGEDPFGYHLFNVLVHIANGVLVYGLAAALIFILSGRRELSSDYRMAAFFSALLFLVHPVQTQAVSYVTQRFTSLTTFFYLLAVWSYLIARLRFEDGATDGRVYAFYGVSLLSTALAMRTKEIAFTIPVVLFLFEALLFSQSRLHNRRYLHLVPFAVFSLLIPLSLLGPEWGLMDRSDGVAEITRAEKLGDLTNRPALPYLFTQFRVIVVYLRTLIFPVGLRVVYDFPISYSFWSAKVIASFLLLILLAGCAVFLWKKGAASGQEKESIVFRLAAIGIFWFFITLSIESSIIPIKDVIFEHRIYLPSVGFLMSAAVLVLYASDRLLQKAGRNGSYTTAVVVLMALPLAVGTYVRNDVWTEEFKLWDDAVKKEPNKPIGYNNRAMAYAKRGQYKEALSDINKTISFFPATEEDAAKWENADMNPVNMAKTYVARGDIYIALGNIEEAKEDYRRSKMLIPAPANPDNRLVLADQYVKRGAYKHALDIYNAILQGDPEHIEALNDRANTYSRLGRFDEAISDFTRITGLAPDFVLAYHNRGVALVQIGKNDRALHDFETACKRGFPPACESADILRETAGNIAGER